MRGKLQSILEAWMPWTATSQEGSDHASSFHRHCTPTGLASTKETTFLWTYANQFHPQIAMIDTPENLKKSIFLDAPLQQIGGISLSQLKIDITQAIQLLDIQGYRQELFSQSKCLSL